MLWREPWRILVGIPPLVVFLLSNFITYFRTSVILIFLNSNNFGVKCELIFIMPNRIKVKSWQICFAFAFLLFQLVSFNTSTNILGMTDMTIMKWPDAQKNHGFSLFLYIENKPESLQITFYIEPFSKPNLILAIYFKMYGHGFQPCLVRFPFCTFQFCQRQIIIGSYHSMIYKFISLNYDFPLLSIFDPK